MKKSYQVLDAVKYNFEGKGENKKLVSYVYYFNNGEKMHIDNSIASEELMAELQEMARLEYNCAQRERRRKLKAMKIDSSKNNKDSKDSKNTISRRTTEYRVDNPVLSEVIRREGSKRIWQALAELRPEQQELIRLAYIEDMKQCDIAKHYNTSASDISHKLRRAKSNLKKTLAV